MTAPDDSAAPTMVAPADAVTTTQLLRLYDLCMLGAARSYELDRKAERARSNRDLEELFFRAVDHLAPDLFIEAGAKDAAASRRVSEALPSARVVAFEANPYTYKRFKKRMRRKAPSVEYVHRALSDAPGKVTFHVMKTDTGEPSADGQGSLITRTDPARGQKEVTVKATTLDAHFAAEEFRSCALWIDVEGATREVIGGGAAVLRKASVVIVEVEDRAFWDGQWLSLDVLRAFYDAGMLPVARDFQSRHQYNVLFVREELWSDSGLRAELARQQSGAAFGGPRGAAGPVTRPVTEVKSKATRAWRKVRKAAARRLGALAPTPTLPRKRGRA